MGRTPDKISRPQWERELLAEASRLNVLGLDPLATLRRVRQEHEKPSPPESDDRAEAILSALAWLSTPEAKRTVRAPELTSLSDVEAEAIHAAIVAVEAGVPIAAIVAAELEVEEVFQEPRDRKAGRVTSLKKLPPFPDILEREPYALFSYRIRMLFMDWLPTWLPTARKGAKTALLDALDTSKSVEERKADALAARVWLAVATFRELGLTRDDAMEAVARGLDPLTDPVDAYNGVLPPGVLDDELPVSRRPVIPPEALVARDFARRARGLPPSGLRRHEALPVSLMPSERLPRMTKGQVQGHLERADRNLVMARKIAGPPRKSEKPRKPRTAT